MLWECSQFVCWVPLGIPITKCLTGALSRIEGCKIHLLPFATLWTTLPAFASTRRCRTQSWELAIVYRGRLNGRGCLNNSKSGVLDGSAALIRLPRCVSLYRSVTCGMIAQQHTCSEPTAASSSSTSSAQSLAIAGVLTAHAEVVAMMLQGDS